MQFRDLMGGVGCLLTLVCNVGCAPETIPAPGITYTLLGSVNACTPGSLRCMNNTVQECTADVWSTVNTCVGASVCTQSGAIATCQTPGPTLPQMAVTNNRGAAGTSVVTATAADSFPSILLDGDYCMWWQGNGAVLFSESSQLDGPWGQGQSSSQQVFGPSGGANFDSVSVGAPDVLGYQNSLYMYYVGGNGNQTAIGVASTTDFFDWQRTNGGAPIVRSVSAQGSVSQPHAVRYNNQFYLFYSDSAGVDNIGALGTYVLRADDPLFSTNVQELQIGGFVPFANVAHHTSFAVANVPNVDWAYTDVLDAFVAVSSTATQSNLLFFDPNLTRINTNMAVPGGSVAGTAMVTKPDGHTPPATACTSIPVDLMLTLGATGFSHAGVDLSVAMDCNQVPVVRVYDNTEIEQTNSTGPLVVEQGQGILFADAGAAFVVTETQLTVSDDIYARIPVVAQVPDKAAGYTTTGLAGGFFDSNTNLFLPLGCTNVEQANNSNFTVLSASQYAALKQGPSLYCTP